MADPLTKAEVEKAKQTQRAIIAECDKAIADLQYNIGVVQDLVIQQRTKKNVAKDTLAALIKDFPEVV